MPSESRRTLAAGRRREAPRGPAAAEWSPPVALIATLMAASPLAWGQPASSDGTTPEGPTAAETAAPPSADADPQQHEDGRPVGGVEVHIRVWHPQGSAHAREPVTRALREIERIHAKFASEVRVSEVATINRAADREEVLVSDETYHLLLRALHLCQRTEGAYDPTVAVYDYLWNLRRRPLVRPLPDELDARRKIAGCQHLLLKPGRIVRLLQRGGRVRLDDLARGQAVEAAAATLRAGGIDNFRIRIGSHVHGSGRAGMRHWYVALRHPDDPARDLMQLYLNSHSAATRHWGGHIMRDGTRYHDVLDPRSGVPAAGVASVTVISIDPVEAEALAAAVFVLGPKRGIALIDRTDRVAGFVIDASGKVYASKNMADFSRLPARVDL